MFGSDAVRTDNVSSPEKQLHTPLGYVTPSSSKSTGLRPSDLESNSKKKIYILLYVLPSFLNWFLGLLHNQCIGTIHESNLAANMID
jgi:hypothetical protein